MEDNVIYEENSNNNEEFENTDDDYLRELHQHLFQMQKERKKAQLEAELLQNRVNLLKAEEGKVISTTSYFNIQSYKKIENTVKKTEDKLLTLQKIDEHNKRKQEVIHKLIIQFKEKKMIELDIQKENNIKLKSDIKYNLQQKKEQKMNQINEEARRLKEEKKV